MTALLYRTLPNVLWLFVLPLSGHLMISAMQQFVRQPSDQYVRLGQNVVLPCQVSGAVGRVQWTRDEFGLGVIRDLPSYPRYQMIGDNTEGIYSLEIQRVSLEDDAVFQCQVGAAVGQKGIRSHDARLTVLVPPEPPRIIQGDSIVSSAGHIVQLDCESLGGKPAAEIEWYLGEREVIESQSTSEVSRMRDGKRSAVRSSLTLNATTALHGAFIACRSHNPALGAPQTTAIRLTVRFPPQITLTLSPARPSEGSDVTVTCLADASPSQMMIEWYIDGDLVSGEDGSALKLTNVERTRHNISITCKVTNEIGSSQQSVVINVLHSPWFPSEPRNVTAEIGDDVTLVCDAAGNPQPHVLWYRKDCHHSTTTTCSIAVGNGPNLHLVATRGTTGHYECHASSVGFSPIRGHVSLLLRSRPQVTAPRVSHARMGATSRLTCSVGSLPRPAASQWSFEGIPVNFAIESRYSLEDTPMPGGVRSQLVISKTRQLDLGTYQCSFSNQFGTGSASISLQQQGFPVLTVTLTALTLATLFLLITSLLVICLRRHRQAAGKPSGTNSGYGAINASDINQEETKPMASDVYAPSMASMERQRDGLVDGARGARFDGGSADVASYHDQHRLNMRHDEVLEESYCGSGYPAVQPAQRFCYQPTSIPPGWSPRPSEFLYDPKLPEMTRLWHDDAGVDVEDNFLRSGGYPSVAEPSRYRSRYVIEAGLNMPGPTTNV